MSNIVNLIASKNFIKANSVLSEAVELIMARKLEEAKKMVAAKIEEQPHSMNRSAAKLRSMDIAEEDIEEAIDPEEATGGPVPKGQRVNQVGKGDKEQTNTTVVPKNNIKEEEQLDEARVNIVKARIRGGKIQRRKRVSNVPGMTIRGGKLQRMSAAERRRRKMGARKAVRKRAPKMNRALMKRKRSLMKRRALGL